MLLHERVGRVRLEHVPEEDDLSAASGHQPQSVPVLRSSLPPTKQQIAAPFHEAAPLALALTCAAC